MAFPFIGEYDFELGSTGEFDSETDANGVLDVLHYREIAGRNQLNLMPYRGNYAMVVNLNGADTNQYLEETATFDMTSETATHFRIVFAVTTDLTMAASDRFTIFAWQSGSGTDEVVMDIRNNAGTIEVLAAETGAASTVRNAALPLGVWHVAEISATPDTDSDGDGTVDFYLNGVQVGAQLGSLTQAAITQTRLGVIGKDAGTTEGRVIISELTADDARLFPYTQRFRPRRTFTKSGQFFSGPGYVTSLEAVSTASDNVIRFYDTDRAGDWSTAGTPDDTEGFVAELDPDALIGSALPLRFENGCFVYMTGTDPRCVVGYSETSWEGYEGPLTQSEGSMRAYALRT